MQRDQQSPQPFPQVFPMTLTSANCWTTFTLARGENPDPAGKYNLLIVGAGPAGLLAALSRSAVGAKVAIIERNLLGGACFNVGCIPSKAIIRSARLYAGHPQWRKLRRASARCRRD